MKRLAKLAVLFAVIAIAAFIPPKKYIDPANMDLSVKPGDNFYLYANGAWIKNNPIPKSKTRWGSFDELHEESIKRLRTLLTEAVAKSATDPSMQKIGDFYASGMDTVAVDKLGYQPIKADLQRIGAIRDMNSFLNELAYDRVQGIGSALF